MACNNLKRSKKQRFNEGVFVGLGMGVGLILSGLAVQITIKTIAGIFLLAGF